MKRKRSRFPQPVEDPADNWGNTRTAAHAHAQQIAYIAADLEALAAEMLASGAPPESVYPARRARALLLSMFRVTGSEEMAKGMGTTGMGTTGMDKT